jgi:plasmid stabilization system protein ParE
VSRPVHWSVTATEHLAAIARYIGRTSPVYAERMVDRLLARTAQLKEFPESGRHVAEVSDEHVRELLEGPYRIIYLVQAARIDVLAVVHGRQDVPWPQ